MYKAVIFDYDGVVADTLAPNYEAWTLIGKELGFSIPDTHDEFGKLFVKDWQEVLNDFGANTPEKFAKTQEIYKSNLYHLSREVRPFEGIPELLKQLHESGFRLVIASGNYGDYLRHQLQQFGLADYFDMISGSEDSEAPKPHPSQLQYILKHLACGPHEVIYVGDMVVDMQAGKQAGVAKNIGVAYGWHGRGLLEEHGADVVVDEPLEILNHVES